MLLRRYNLNLLPILRELLRTRSVSRTAEAVGLSQSSVSAALQKLRLDLEDPLLAPVGRGFVLTERASRLVEPVERACAEMEGVLRPGQFLPVAETRRFVVATADYVTFLLAPRIAQAMSTQAPAASVQFVDVGDDSASRLDRGEVDLLVIPRSTSGPFVDRYSFASLFGDQTVVIAAAANKNVGDPLTLEQFERASHASFHLAARTSASHENRQLKRARVKHKDRILVEQFSALPAIVESTECLALIQRKLAEHFRRTHDIAIHIPPFPVEDVEILAFWTLSSDRDPSHSWFRSIVASAARQLAHEN